MKVHLHLLSTPYLGIPLKVEALLAHEAYSATLLVRMEGSGKSFSLRLYFKAADLGLPAVSGGMHKRSMGGSGSVVWEMGRGGRGRRGWE